MKSFTLTNLGLDMGIQPPIPLISITETIKNTLDNNKYGWGVYIHTFKNGIRHCKSSNKTRKQEWLCINRLP